MSEVRVLELEEYVPIELKSDELTDSHADLLYAKSNGKISLEAPGPATGHKWRLTSNGWVGYWPITTGLALSLKPRVPLRNIFGMLEYAYDIKVFNLPDVMHQCSSLREFYENLALVLAKRVLSRSRRGFYRKYVAREEQLMHLRGRIDIERSIRRPWDPSLPCRYQDHTADIDDNAILSQTLNVIARSGLCTERSAPTVRRAYRAIAGLAPPNGATVVDCLGRLYNRLNKDYQPMHALCRFFLEHSGPTHDAGDRDMLPFMVHMPALFEKFVAEYLKVHLPPELDIKPQYTVNFGDNRELKIQIDLFLCDNGGKAICVLDTKYKISDQAKTSDCQQVVAYAVGKSCRDAVLIYPSAITKPMDVMWGDVRLRTMTFDLSGDIEKEGGVFLNNLVNSNGFVRS